MAARMTTASVEQLESRALLSVTPVTKIGLPLAPMNPIAAAGKLTFTPVAHSPAVAPPHPTVVTPLMLIPVAPMPVAGIRLIPAPGMPVPGIGMPRVPVLRPVPARPVPAAPTGLTGVPADGRVSLAWTAPASNGGPAINDYVVQFSANAGATWTTFADAVSAATSATVTGLMNGTSYVFRVAAVNAVGAGAASVPSAAIVPLPPAPPPVPTGVTVASSTDSSVTLSWNDVSGESGYRIERSSDAATWTEVGRGTFNATTFKDELVEEVTRYSYRIIAVNAAGASAPSAIVTAEIGLRAPGGVVATVVHGGRIDLTWVDRSSRESHYLVEYFDLATNDWTYVMGGAFGSSMTVTGEFPPTTNCQFRVRAVSFGWNHALVFSETATASVITPVYPNMPTGVTVALVTGSSVTLSWNDVSGENEYLIERSSDDATWAEVGRGIADATDFKDDHLEESTWYSYRVIAVNAAGASAPGAVVSAETRLFAPDDVVAAVINGGLIDLNWVDRSSRETHYVVEQLDHAANEWVRVGDAPVDGSGMIVAGVFAPDTNQQFRVRAVSAEWGYTYASSDDVTASVTTPAYPAAPGGLTATAFSDHVRLSWEFRPDVAVVVERMTGGGEWTAVTEITSTASFYEDYDLEPSTAYAYRIAFRNAHGSSAFSGIVSAETAAGPGVAAAYRSPSAVFVGWTRPLKSATGIIIERAASGSDAWTAIATLAGTATSYTDAEVVLGTSYRYRIVFERGVRSPLVATSVETGPGPRDSDGDQLNDGEELAIGTNPRDFSTDSDQLGDGFERSNGLDPMAGDEDGNGVLDQDDDFDGDGLANWREAVFGTSTSRADENGDGRPDGADSDGDGVSDGTEVSQGSDPVSSLDRGEAPSADARIKLRLSVGDPSGSRSEQWALRVGAILQASATYGEVGSGEYFFDVGKSYPITLEHQGSRIPSATPAPVERITKPAFSQTISVSVDTPFAPTRRPSPILQHTIVIPDHIALPVMLNISGSVNDDLLLDGQSITDELQIDGSYLDPGPYPDTVGYGYVGAHAIGSLPGPFQDTVNGGITFKWNKREFTVACRDTIGAGAGIDITIRVTEYPDHDWYANIEPTDRPEFFVVDDNTPLYIVGPYQGDGMSEQVSNVASLEATLHVPRFDADVDSRNDSGYAVPDDNREEDRLENDASTGKLVFVGAAFVPMVVRLSSNVAEAQPSATSVFFDYDPKVFRLWKPGYDAGTARMPSDIIPARTWVGADEIGLEPGGNRTVYVEAIDGTSSTAAPITTSVRIEGARWSGTLKDTVHLLPVEVDLDVDSDNDGRIDPDDGPAGTDDPIEEQAPGHILFVNSDDDDRNGVADVFDVGHVAGENDLAEVVFVVPSFTGTGSGTAIVTYDETIVRLYRRPDRSGGVVSGSPIAAETKLYAEGRMAGTSLVTVTFATHTNTVRVTDTVRLTVQPYPVTIDVDVDSDNNNDFGLPARSEWEEILENHDYGIGKLIMLDNPQRKMTPIVLQMPTGLPADSGSVRLRIDWDDDGAAGSVRLWSRDIMDAIRNPAAVDRGGDAILPGGVYKLSDLWYNAEEGRIIIFAEGIRENAALKTLAGVEAAPRVDERIRGTLVVNGDDTAFDEVKYIVANEDSFYHALHTRQEVRNALASRGVYSFDDMPKFSLEPKSEKDLGLGDGDTARLGSDVPGFKAMVYQDYITGKDQYVLAFGGTDDNIWQLEYDDWRNNIKQGLGWSAPQYTAAMALGDAVGRAVGQTQLIVTGHSLGGGLASAAALVAAVHADTFNAAGLHEYTLYERDQNDAPLSSPAGGYVERYSGSAARYQVAGNFITSYYVDHEILNFVQGFIGRTAIGIQREMDGPGDLDLTLSVTAFTASVAARISWTTAAAGLYAFGTMVDLHYRPSMLYGLLVTEGRLGGFRIDMLGYSSYF
jgi:hypothetical protein